LARSTITMCCQSEKDWLSTDWHAVTRLLLWRVGVMIVNLIILRGLAGSE
jgi:hypothetical protein